VRQVRAGATVPVEVDPVEIEPVAAETVDTRLAIARIARIEYFIR
jgi:hypothetical protein